MRFVLIIFSVALLSFACVKRQSKNPIPVIEYRELASAGKVAGTQRDTALLVLGYEDGDGDLFLDYTAQGPNVVFIDWHYDAALGKFEIDIDPITQDTHRITASIKQPDDGYYKGKSIKGEIYIPMSQFRTSDDIKILKFTGFMIDVKGHRSNSVASPVYTLNF